MQVKFIKQSDKNLKNRIIQIISKDRIIKTRGIYFKELLRLTTQMLFETVTPNTREPPNQNVRNNHINNRL